MARPIKTRETSSSKTLKAKPSKKATTKLATPKTAARTLAKSLAKATSMSSAKQALEKTLGRPIVVQKNGDSTTPTSSSNKRPIFRASQYSTTPSISFLFEDASSEDVRFNVGDNAVYPAHGVAVIKRIDEREVGGKKKQFYVLQVLENEMTIMVPTDNAKAVGLRPIVGSKEILNVYKILQMKDVRVDNTTWNRRYRECMEKIRTGSVYEIAEVLRNLYILKNNKDLSFGERKMLDTAKQLLVRELSIAKKTDEQSIEAELSSIFGD